MRLLMRATPFVAQVISATPDPMMAASAQEDIYLSIDLSGPDLTIWPHAKYLN
jgi:hypothetical protein